MQVLEEFCTEPIGAQFITGKDELFVLPPDYVRRLNVPNTNIMSYATGEDVRDWTVLSSEVILFPYTGKLEPLPELLPQGLESHWKPFKKALENVVISGSIKKKETKLKWFEFRRLSRAKFLSATNIINPHIATHVHFVIADHSIAYKEKVQAIVLKPEYESVESFAFISLFNSSFILDFLKRVSFNKGAGDEEERDRFEYSGDKLKQLPIPSNILKNILLRDQLTALSRVCWERGQQLPSLAFKKLFEMKGEAYYAWNSSLAGWVSPARDLSGFGNLTGLGFRTADELLAMRDAYTAERERLRREMIALQEEMDWLVYAAYDLLPPNHPAVGAIPVGAIHESPLRLGERPFELLRDNKPMPAHFSPARRALWDARMKVIGENEHIRRIEQPVYKRRWYRKESDEQEFERAFEWWLLEKAEWWLEHKAKGGPVALDRWATALWDDERVRAAVEALTLDPTPTAQERGVPVKQTAFSADYAAAPDSFIKLFKTIVVESTVPDWIPPAMPWEQVEKKFKEKVPARARKIRGKLNVPRERFRLNKDGEYVWAGKA